jgi:formylglycine-generating enzyme required for sulfatase activity
MEPRTLSRRGWLFVSAVLLALGVWMVLHWRADEVRYERWQRGETVLVISSPPNVTLELFRAGNSLADASPVALVSEKQWLPAGNYFLKVKSGAGILYYPVPLTSSPHESDEPFVITVRPVPAEFPPKLLLHQPDYVFIPSGTFLLGDRLNPREPHAVWLTGYFVGSFEVTNEEFRTFLSAADGYWNDSLWTVDGLRWRATGRSQVSALLKPSDARYQRFGQPDQPVTWVNWFEANAFCRWLTKRLGAGRWWYALPTEAEWEKAARGPDSFDYGLGMTISDAEVTLYNWKKNPDAPVTVVGWKATLTAYQSNRYGLYHMSGNVAEWSQGVLVPYNRNRPYRDDERNHDETPGLRVVRGGSWYSAATSYLYIPYRDAFQPEHSSQETGFRVVVRRLP